MARRNLPTAWESAPDIIRMDFSPQKQQVHPHSQLSPLPHSPRRRQPVRGITRRGTYPEERVNQWLEHGRHTGAPHHFPGYGDIPSPPYPVTPPLERPEPALGYRAPTPLPPPTMPPPPESRPAKPPRLLQIQRQCVRGLDASLRELSITSLALGSSLLISSILFVRSLLEDTPHAPAGRTALLVFFCISAIAFGISFGLVLSVLCRRARGGRSSNAVVHAREEVELREIGSRNGAGRLPLYNSRRRNAVSGSPGEPHVTSGVWPAAHRLVRDDDRIIHRQNGPPVRVASRSLLETRPSRLVSRHPSALDLSQFGSPEILARPRTPLVIGSGASSTVVQLSPDRDAVSPRTVPRASQHTVSGSSTQMFNQHMLTAGTRELQAYLDASSNLSLNTLSATHSINDDPDSDHASISNYHSRYSDEQSLVDYENEVQLGTASAVTLRNVGKAHECYIRGPTSAVSAPGSNKTHKQKKPKIAVLSERESVQTRRHQSVLDPLPSVPVLPLAHRNLGNQLLSVQRSRSLSPKKLSKASSKPRAIGLGISMRGEQDKENVEPREAAGRRSEESDEFCDWHPIVPFEGA